MKKGLGYLPNSNLILSDVACGTPQALLAILGIHYATLLLWGIIYATLELNICIALSNRY